MRLAIVPFLLVGCASPLARTARTPERCAALDDRRVGYGAAAKGFAVLGGGSGLATLPMDDGAMRTGVAIAGLVSAGVAAGLVYASEGETAAHDRECR